MKYIGKLYGKLGGKYFPTGKTSEDWDELETNYNEAIEALKMCKSHMNIFTIRTGVNPELNKFVQQQISKHESTGNN